jgi:pyruvate formate lyase activating enzyme
MHPAGFWSPEGDGVRCRLCLHECHIGEGQAGFCRVRRNIGGKLYSLVWGKLCSANPDPIEKKPLYHFLPGSKAYSIATVGCNLRCRGCQNWEISQTDEIFGSEMSPEDIVSQAISHGCASIAYTYTEPTVFLEYALDIADAARDKGLRNVFVSNGYVGDEARDCALPFLDACNIDLKSFSDKTYKSLCNASLEPVLKTLRELVKAGVWVEVTTLIIPKVNNSRQELSEIAQFISGELGEHVPWHVSAFHPDYMMGDSYPTDDESILTAAEIGLDAGLKYVYAGNIKTNEYMNTLCPCCGNVVIKRQGYTILSNTLEDTKCPGCGHKMEGVWN